jgi:hypothetical protein
MTARVGSGLLALVLAASGITGGMAHLCRMTGEVRTSCCCPEPEEAEPGPPTAGRPDTCCELRVTEPALRPMAVDKNERRAELPRPSAIAVPVVDQDVCARVAPVVADARGPPAAPLYDLHCTYLL